MSAITRSFTRSAFRNPSIQLRRGGGHAEGYNQPTGYLFGEKVHIRHPENKKYGHFGEFEQRTGLLVKGNIKCGHDHHRQDITEESRRHDCVHTWAYREAKARMEARGEAVEYKKQE
ncbi:hypothetical protein BG000_007722 [Podila horticola]|nr:hypothetical protein BG000_007722 [Podila horticola]